MEKQKIKRIVFLDEIRGFSVILMILYHGFFLMSEIFNLETGSLLFKFFMPAQPFVSGVFILVSGISSRLSRSNALRGFKLFLIALALSLATVILLPLMGLEGLGIYFGILHLLSISMLFFATTHKLLDKIPPFLGLIGSCVLYFFTANIGRGFLGFSESLALSLPKSLYEQNYLFPLGIHGPDFSSADYFPIFPRIFIFLAGSYLALALKDADLPEWLYKRRVRIFEFLGRHALLAYLLHLPVIYVLVLLVEYLIGFFSS